MNIYIFSENEYFYIGMKNIFSFENAFVNKLDEDALSAIDVNRFHASDVFVFHTASYSAKLLLLIHMGYFRGKLIFIPVTKMQKFKSIYKNHIVLEHNAKIDDVSKEIKWSASPDLGGSVLKDFKLTERETLILQYTLNGLGAGEIGDCLSISAKTVYANRQRAVHKMGGRNIVDVLSMIHIDNSLNLTMSSM